VTRFRFNARAASALFTAVAAKRYRLYTFAEMAEVASSRELAPDFGRPRRYVGGVGVR
jgi:hypothetical protein